MEHARKTPPSFGLNQEPRNLGSEQDPPSGVESAGSPGTELAVVRGSGGGSVSARQTDEVIDAEVIPRMDAFVSKSYTNMMRWGIAEMLNAIDERMR